MDATYRSENRPRRPDRLVVVGNGMVGHRLVETLVARGAHRDWDVTVLGEERRPAYDRVRLSSWFSGADADQLCLVPPGFYEANGIAAHLGDPVAVLDRARHVVVTRTGREVRYDRLVLATGSLPFVPSIPGIRAAGVFTYRTIEDTEAIAAWASRTEVRRGAVIGGGLLGLEAASALMALGLQTHVVELSDRLMPVQLDERGAGALQRRVEHLGVTVHLGCSASELTTGIGPAVSGLRFEDRDDLMTDLVVVSAGIRPRDELARASGLVLGTKGGIAVDDTLTTSDADIHAIGEIASHEGRLYGLVGPGYEMARVLVDRLGGDERAAFVGANTSTRLKLLGVDVATFGDAFATTGGSRGLTWDDPINDIYKKLVVSAGGTEVLGGMLVGDASGFADLAAMAAGDLPTPTDPSRLLAPATVPAILHRAGVASLAAEAVICSCNGVTKASVCSAIDDGATTIRELGAATRAGTTCGGCIPLLTDVLDDRLAHSGLPADRTLCEHFALSRQDLFSLIRVRCYTSFSQVLAAHGSGMGCDLCKPAIASILASLHNGHILDGEQSSLQDTNDHLLANLQRDGTYSVVPRIPGGEISPGKLMVLSEVAHDFGLYTKITGGQRIALFGARVEQLPAIWRRLVDAGFESGHAYGKAVRTVKSCVGSTWCRYGVQDSVSMAIALELRYRGLRAPHKVKMAVSGCARECAEALSKDVGVIATEGGWNLYVCGNGGQRPRHAVLLAESIDTATLVQLVDRFLMLYIATADRLERTASWLEKLDGGLMYLRSVVVEDALGIAAELEADMARHVETHECEWKAAIDDPGRLKHFRSFVNAPVLADPEILMVPERDQIRPARPDERAAVANTEQTALRSVIAGETREVLTR